MESKGFGDTLEKVFKATGVSTLVEKTTELLGIEDCGCVRRKEWVNNLIPYNQNSIEYKELIPQNSLDLKEGVYIFNRRTILNDNNDQVVYNEGDRILVELNSNRIIQYKQLFELGIISIDESININNIQNN